jgi:hypothetical protein
MNKRPEVIAYMRRIGLKVSLRYCGFFILAIVVGSLLTSDWNLLVAIPFILMFFTIVHFIIRWNMERTMYPFYCESYDLRQKCLKALEELGVKK